VRIATVVGARPQFIKAAAVSRLLRARLGTSEILIHTGQHYDNNMSEVFFSELEIPTPDFFLGIGSGSHGVQTGRMLEALEKVLLDTLPDWVVVYGDTNSTLAGALAAAKLHIKVAHVEAGLRSFNRQMPEEINRILTDHLADLLFVPTETAVQNLQHEGIDAAKIYYVGDVMYDASLYYGEKSERTSLILKRLKLEPQNYLLATIHRAENTDDVVRLQTIFNAFSQIAQEIRLVVPLHPRTRAALQRYGLLAEIPPSVQLIDPVGYLDMVMLEKNARLIATDSGGIQKEAYFYRVPCVILRDETEWVELLDLGWNVLCPPINTETIVNNMMARPDNRGTEKTSLFGEGMAAATIVQLLA
jgi:UDP-GlcNAc3NAcA epimerase